MGYDLFVAWAASCVIGWCPLIAAGQATDAPLGPPPDSAAGVTVGDDTPRDGFLGLPFAELEGYERVRLAQPSEANPAWVHRYRSPMGVSLSIEVSRAESRDPVPDGSRSAAVRNALRHAIARVDERAQMGHFEAVDVLSIAHELLDPADRVGQRVAVARLQVTLNTGEEERVEFWVIARRRQIVLAQLTTPAGDEEAAALAARFHGYFRTLLDAAQSPQ